MHRAEAFRRFVHYSEIKHLLDRLLILQEQEKFHSVAVLSEFDNEGKTFTTAALALAYTERLSKKALIVDTSTPHRVLSPASARKRQQAELLNELLEKSESVDVIALHEWSGVKKDGKTDEYQLKALFSQVASQYSIVLVDTSSLSRRNRNNFDPAVIARQCDASLLVSARAEIAQDISQQNRDRLMSSGVKLIGLIHNEGDLWKTMSST